MHYFWIFFRYFSLVKGITGSPCFSKVRLLDFAFTKKGKKCKQYSTCFTASHYRGSTPSAAKEPLPSSFPGNYTQFKLPRLWTVSLSTAIYLNSSLASGSKMCPKVIPSSLYVAYWRLWNTLLLDSSGNLYSLLCFFLSTLKVNLRTINYIHLEYTVWWVLTVVYIQKITSTIKI